MFIEVSRYPKLKFSLYVNNVHYLQSLTNEDIHINAYVYIRRISHYVSEVLSVINL